MPARAVGRAGPEASDVLSEDDRDDSVRTGKRRTHILIRQIAVRKDIYVKRSKEDYTI